MNRMGMAKIRRPKLTPVVLDMLQRARDDGDPFGGKSYGGLVNVFRAAVLGGWLETGTGAITEEGRKVLAAREGRRQDAA